MRVFVSLLSAFLDAANNLGSSLLGRKREKNNLAVANELMCEEVDKKRDKKTNPMETRATKNKTSLFVLLYKWVKKSFSN